MLELIKKSVLASLGAAAVSKEAAEKQLNQWVKQGKISSHEAQEMAMMIVKQGKGEFDNARTELSKFFTEMLTKANVANMSDIEDLKKRVTALEGKTGKSSSKCETSTDKTK